MRAASNNATDQVALEAFKDFRLRHCGENGKDHGHGGRSERNLTTQEESVYTITPTPKVRRSSHLINVVITRAKDGLREADC